MRFGLIILTILTLSACGGVSVNQSYYPYMYSADNKLAPNARLVIAPENLGIPSRKYLQRFEPRVDNLIKQKLQNAGYTVVSSRIYKAAYDEAVTLVGHPFNATTGKLNTERLGQVLGLTFNSLLEGGAVDAIVYTDLVEKETSLIRSDSKRFTRFDGVQRKMKVQGASSGVGEGFDWNANVDVVSLSLNIFKVEGGRVLHNMGGLDNADAIDTRKNEFSRSRSIMKSDKLIIEGVDLALHPLIFSKLYVEQTAQ